MKISQSVCQMNHKNVYEQADLYWSPSVHSTDFEPVVMFSFWVTVKFLMNQYNKCECACSSLCSYVWQIFSVIFLFVSQPALQTAKHHTGVSSFHCCKKGIYFWYLLILVVMSSCLFRSRTDVVTVTPWSAPIIWEGTFSPVLLDTIYKPKNISVAVTVFAVGKWVLNHRVMPGFLVWPLTWCDPPDRYIMFLKNFLETAEQHFFIGYRVHVYVFTDRPDDVPKFKLAPGRQVNQQTSERTRLHLIRVNLKAPPPPLAVGACSAQFKSLAGDLSSQDGAHPDADRGEAV